MKLNPIAVWRTVTSPRAGLPTSTVFHFIADGPPDLGREPLRAISRLPGTTGGAISARTNIRGGEEDEVVLLFDGLPLHEPFHLRHFQEAFSVLDARVIGGMEVFTGGFPAQYGDRLSGVVDIRPIEPPPGLREVANSVFSYIEPLPVYGRGDWVRGADGEFLLMELELVEPSLYLRTDALAPARFASAFDEWFQKLTGK